MHLQGSPFFSSADSLPDHLHRDLVPAAHHAPSHLPCAPFCTQTCSASPKTPALNMLLPVPSGQLPLLVPMPPVGQRAPLLPEPIPAQHRLGRVSLLCHLRVCPPAGLAPWLSGKRCFSLSLNPAQGLLAEGAQPPMGPALTTDPTEPRSVPCTGTPRLTQTTPSLYEGRSSILGPRPTACTVRRCSDLGEPDTPQGRPMPTSDSPSGRSPRALLAHCRCSGRACGASN